MVIGRPVHCLLFLHFQGPCVFLFSPLRYAEVRTLYSNSLMFSKSLGRLSEMFFEGIIVINFLEASKLSRKIQASLEKRAEGSELAAYSPQRSA